LISGFKKIKGYFDILKISLYFTFPIKYNQIISVKKPKQKQGEQK